MRCLKNCSSNNGHLRATDRTEASSYILEKYCCVVLRLQPGTKTMVWISLLL